MLRGLRRKEALKEEGMGCQSSVLETRTNLCSLAKSFIKIGPNFHGVHDFWDTWPDLLLVVWSIVLNWNYQHKFDSQSKNLT